jgi:serine/threonine protein kinase
VLLGSDGSARLADFGLAKVMASAQYARSMAGTKAFMAPEVLAEEPYDTKVKSRTIVSN